MRDNGCTAEVTAAAIEQMRLHVIHLVTVDDLNHLHRGGRLSKTSAVVGSLLGIKPLIWVNDEGKLEVCGKVRGSQKAIQYLADRTLREISDKNQTVRIGHGDCPEDAQMLANLLKKWCSLGYPVYWHGHRFTYRSRRIDNFLLWRQPQAGITTYHFDSNRPGQYLSGAVLFACGTALPSSA